MYYCQICKQIISDKELNKTYQLTLGNMINGKFLGKQKQYIHLSCLDIENNKNPKIISSLNQ